MLVLGPSCLIFDVISKAVSFLLGKIGVTLGFDGCVMAFNSRMACKHSCLVCISVLHISTPSHHEPRLSLEFMVPFFFLLQIRNNWVPHSLPLDGGVATNRLVHYVYMVRIFC